MCDENDCEYLEEELYKDVNAPKPGRRCSQTRRGRNATFYREMRINTSILYIDIVLRRHLHLTSCNFACKNTWHELSKNATISMHSDCQLKLKCFFERAHRCP